MDARPEIPEHVERILRTLWTSGHAAYVVGGGLRDELLGRAAADWDVATSARPEELRELFPGSHYENRFGTVTVDRVQVTTFRRDHRYSDHRRPDQVTFTHDLHEDLARRDFTINAIAWGRPGDPPDSTAPDPAWVDPAGGWEDLRARLIRAVGEPAARFEEDALRLLRAARLAAQLDFSIEAATLAAMERGASLVEHVSRERVGQELRKLVGAERPSAGLRILERTALLAPLFPELAEQRGVPQNKIPGHDLWDHTVLTVDAAARIARANGRQDDRLVLAALLHDVGKPSTRSEEGFPEHDVVGARIAERFLARLAVPRRDAAPVVELVRWHMFGYAPTWGDAAVRRFLRRVGPGIVDDLLLLREADNVGSGKLPDAGGVAELRARIRDQLERAAPLDLSDLALDGHDLQAELGIAPGPPLGQLLDRLLEAVVQDPERNTRAELLALARSWTRPARQRTRNGTARRAAPARRRGGQAPDGRQEARAGR